MAKTFCCALIFDEEKKGKIGKKVPFSISYFNFQEVEKRRKRKKVGQGEKSRVSTQTGATYMYMHHLLALISCASSYFVNFISINLCVIYQLYNFPRTSVTL